MGGSHSHQHRHHLPRIEVPHNSEAPKTDFCDTFHCSMAVGYKCNLCEEYMNEGDLMEHITITHCNSYFYKCHFCSNYLGCKKDDLFQHQKCKHNIENCFLTCSLCDRFMSPVEEDMVSHIKLVHFNRRDVHVCEYCGFMSENVVDSHILEKHIDYLCKFPDCRVLCQNAYKLFSHYLSHHYPTVTYYYNCSKCDLMFTKKHSLDQHKQEKRHFTLEIDDTLFDKTTTMFICHLCSLETDTKQSFEKHIKKNHPDILYRCPIKDCTYESNLFWIFSKHFVDKHLSQKVVFFFCFKCGSAFRQMCSLLEHLRYEHANEKICPICRTCEEDLANHFVFVHDNENWDEYLSCLICNQDFRLEHQLVDHLKHDHSINLPFYMYTDDIVIYM